MLEITIPHEQFYVTLQKPHYPAYVSTSFLLSELNAGWQVVNAELIPSWDQNGLIYQVTLHHHSHKFSQQILLSKNPSVEELLFEF